MIKINSLKLNIEKDESLLAAKVAAKLGCRESDIISLTIQKKSIDARKKEAILYVYSLLVSVKNEAAILKANSKNKDISKYDGSKEPVYSVIKPSSNAVERIKRPVIVGFGPAGFTCAYLLSKAGLRPIVVERGEEADKRAETVKSFWSGLSEINEDSNVQFGEGGAGTFSDGKLNTMVHDSFGRIRYFFDVLIENGADPSIKYINKPHIGTDKLRLIVKNIRNEIIKNGGEIRFNTKLTDIEIKNGSVVSVTLNGCEKLACDSLILAIGHSARDTYQMLNDRRIAMEKKPFAIGVRVQHPQELISRSQYGDSFSKLPPADYKLTYTTNDTQRAVYSFCMCPGGFVVNSSSEKGRLAINGMSYSGRDEATANSAIVVSVTERDFLGDGVLSGMLLQRELERKAFEACNGLIPSQYLEDYYKCRPTKEFSFEKPNTKGLFGTADLNTVLPPFINESVKEAFYSFDRSIKGFKYDKAIVMGIESRTSAPVRIIRNEQFQSPTATGLFPCGEGAGYAGGITSAGVDGIKVYEAVVQQINTK